MWVGGFYSEESGAKADPKSQKAGGWLVGWWTDLFMRTSMIRFDSWISDVQKMNFSSPEKTVLMFIEIHDGLLPVVFCTPHLPVSYLLRSVAKGWGVKTSRTLMILEGGRRMSTSPLSPFHTTWYAVRAREARPVAWGAPGRAAARWIRKRSLYLLTLIESLSMWYLAVNKIFCFVISDGFRSLWCVGVHREQICLWTKPFI